MLVKTLMKALVIGCIGLGLVGCASKGRFPQTKEMHGVGNPGHFYGQHITPEQEVDLLGKRIYYFGYDSYDVPESDLLSVYAHARHLIMNPKKRIRIEGHTDARGSHEYNIALGEHRAKAIANIMMMKGVHQHQISVVSLGKERPLAKGHHEAAWQQNRRVEIVYEVE